jgi:hypothetical protein
LKLGAWAKALRLTHIGIAYTMSPEPAQRLPNRYLEYTAIALLGFLIVWPLISDYAVIHDEYMYTIWAASGLSLKQILNLGWHHRQFRLFDILGGYLCDPTTLDAKWTMIIQTPALIAIVAAIREGAQRLSPQFPAVFPIAVIWFGLHTATSVALWIPSVGQSLGAAAGVWLALLAWRAVDHLRQGQSVPRWVWGALVALGLIAPHIKETYYGWTFGIAVAIILTWLTLPKAEKRQSTLSNWFLLELAVIVLPLLHMAARMVWGGLGRVTGAAEGRYNAHLGINIIRNCLLTMVGLFADTPVHYIRRAGALKMAAIAGCMLSGALAVKAVKHSRTEGNADSATHTRLLVLVLFAAVLVTSITWPMDRISELYVMGPNAAVALVVAIGAAEFWTISANRYRFICRFVVLAAFAIATFGFASRALHFRTSWKQGRQLYHQAAQFQANLTSDGRTHVIGIPESLSQGWQHSQYVIPPANSFCASSAEQLLNELRPDRRIRINAACSSLDCCDYLLDGSALVPRNSW